MSAVSSGLEFFKSMSYVMRWPPNKVGLSTGFDATPGAVPSAAVSIQQPNGNIKRIAYANASCAIPMHPTCMHACVASGHCNDIKPDSSF